VKKLTIFSAVFLLLSHNAIASPAGPVVSDRWGKTLIAIEFNEVFDRDLDAQDSSFTTYQIDELNQIYGVIGYQLYNADDFNISGYIKLGTAEITLEGANTQSVFPEKHEYEWGFLYGGGLNATFSHFGNMDIIVDAQYQRWQASLEKIEINDQEAILTEGKPDILYQEFQTAVLGQTFFDVGQGVDRFTIAPFAGIAASWIKIDTGDATYNTNSQSVKNLNTSAEQDDLISIVFGTELFAEGNFRFKVDGRYLAEEALSLSGQYEF
jgi:hypothetical protein